MLNPNKPFCRTTKFESLYEIYEDSTVQLLKVDQLDGYLRNSETLNFIRTECHKLQMNDIFISRDLRLFTGVRYKKDPEGTDLSDYDFYDDIGEPPYWCTRSCVKIFGAPDWVNSLQDRAPEVYKRVIDTHCDDYRTALFKVIERQLGAWFMPQLGKTIYPSMADMSILVEIIQLWEKNL